MTKLFKSMIAGLTLLGALSTSSLAIADTTDATSVTAQRQTGVQIVEQNAAERAQLDRAGFPQYGQ